MSFAADTPVISPCVVTRIGPPETGGAAPRPLLVGADDEGWSAGRIVLLALVFLLPAVLAAVYYSALAADVYLSETEFVVRSQGQSGPGLIEGGIGEGAGIAVGAADVNSVIAFIASRDALEAVSQRIDLREAFGAPHGDFLARFPGLAGGDTAEDLYRYYLRQVEVEHDKAAGVTKLTVRAFDPRAAQAIAQALVEEAERIVNGLSERMRSDTLAEAERHVADARRQLLAAQQGLQDWRTREKQYDPALYSKSVVEVVTALSIAIAEARARREELTRTSPRSPELPGLSARIDTLERQIRREWGNLAGANESLAPRISEYERLAIDRDLAVKLYASAKETLARTRAETGRQSVFVERISEPKVPDKPLLPRRVLATLMVCALALMAFLVVDRLAANIRRHRRLAEYVRGGSPAHG
ncbi:hypothetical protein [Aestuariivirga sp.]|jgi:capsular polysaccharide transport system permease protein|uniref:hypothetical protein n=1 Tax=Aestuariivirga sp. TaxID=2650926 RepID=UPI003782E3F2